MLTRAWCAVRAAGPSIHTGLVANADQRLHATSAALLTCCAVVPVLCAHSLQGHPPMVGWVRELTQKLHKPATLPPSPVGFDVTMAPGASAALDALVSEGWVHRGLRGGACNGRLVAYCASHDWLGVQCSQPDTSCSATAMFARALGDSRCSLLLQQATSNSNTHLARTLQLTGISHSVLVCPISAAQTSACCVAANLRVFRLVCC